MGTAEFLRWLLSNGIECSKCGIDVFDGSGRGVIATTAILDDEVVVDVPDDCVLMPENCTISEVALVFLHIRIQTQHFYLHRADLSKSRHTAPCKHGCVTRCCRTLVSATHLGSLSWSALA